MVAPSGVEPARRDRASRDSTGRRVTAGGSDLARRSAGFLALTFFVGILVGSVLGQAVGLFVPEGSVAHQLFVQYEDFGFGPTPIDLVAFDVTIGLYVHVNLMSVIGIFLVAQILRWIR